MDNKICSRCNCVLPLSSFNKLSRSLDGLNYHCRECVKIISKEFEQRTAYSKKYQKQYYQENKDKLLAVSAQWKENNQDRKKMVDKVWSQNNKQEIRIKDRAWYEANKVEVLSKAKEYREKHKEHRKKINRKWLDNNTHVRREYMRQPHNKIAHNLRSRVSELIKGKTKVASISGSIGCSINELKLYLESKFQLGMTWDNYGLYGWHIDHIRPLASFDLTNLEHFKQACHYTNLQPLWAEDNLAKGDKYHE